MRAPESPFCCLAGRERILATLDVENDPTIYASEPWEYTNRHILTSERYPGGEGHVLIFWTRTEAIRQQPCLTNFYNLLLLLPFLSLHTLYNTMSVDEEAFDGAIGIGKHWPDKIIYYMLTVLFFFFY